MSDALAMTAISGIVVLFWDIVKMLYNWKYGSTSPPSESAPQAPQ